MTEIKSVVCPICGCLCDDLEVTVENNEIVKMKNGCAQCEAKMVHGYKSDERILKAYPDLTGDDIREALRYAAEAVREREIPLVTMP